MCLTEIRWTLQAVLPRQVAARRLPVPRRRQSRPRRPIDDGVSACESVGHRCGRPSIFLLGSLPQRPPPSVGTVGDFQGLPVLEPPRYVLTEEVLARP